MKNIAERPKSWLVVAGYTLSLVLFFFANLEVEAKANSVNTEQNELRSRNIALTEVEPSERAMCERLSPLLDYKNRQNLIATSLGLLDKVKDRHGKRKHYDGALYWLDLDNDGKKEMLARWLNFSGRKGRINFHEMRVVSGDYEDEYEAYLKFRDKHGVTIRDKKLRKKGRNLKRRLEQAILKQSNWELNSSPSIRPINGMNLFPSGLSIGKSQINNRFFLMPIKFESRYYVWLHLLDRLDNKKNYVLKFTSIDPMQHQLVCTD